jgi:hypothetical protein
LRGFANQHDAAFEFFVKASQVILAKQMIDDRPKGAQQADQQKGQPYL